MRVCSSHTQPIHKIQDRFLNKDMINTFPPQYFIIISIYRLSNTRISV